MSSKATDAGLNDATGGPTTTGIGLDQNVAGALAYLFGFITGVIVYFLERDNAFVRFHAAQSIVLFGGFTLVIVAVSILSTILSVLTLGAGSGGFFVFSLISLLFTLVWFAASVAGFVLWIYLLVKAYQGATPRIPIVAGIADSLV
jgi:uncharacterized membrane protein